MPKRPPVLSRSPIDSDALYIALDSGITPGGEIRQGSAYRGADPRVQQHPHLFIPDGLTDEEQHLARQAYLNLAIAASQPASTPQPSRFRTMSVAEVVVCVEGFPASGLMAPVFPGKVFPKGHVLVKKYPARFRPATPADLAMAG